MKLPRFLRSQSTFFTLVLSAALTAMFVLPAISQEQGPDGEAPRTKRPSFENGEAPERRGPRPPGAFRGGERGERGERQRPDGFKPDFDRYLENLKERDPEEAKRLMALKEADDKEAFSQAIRKHFESRVGQRMGKGPGGHGMGMFRKPNPKLEAIRVKLRAALEAHHADPSEETKAALRAVIAEEFDEGCADHQRHIDQMEGVIGKMKAAMAEQRSRRDSHIENRLQRALELRTQRPSSGKKGGFGQDGPRNK